MRFINITKNTVYLEDIDTSILYTEDKPQYIDVDDVKKSSGFRRMIRNGSFKIVEHGNSIFEKNLARMKISVEKKQEVKKTVNYTERGEEVEVRIKGHFYDAGGYAKVNRNLAIGLAHRGVKVQIEPICTYLNDLNPLEIRRLSVMKRDLSRDAITLDSMIPILGNQGIGKYKILYTTIESNTIPKQFVDAANNYNEIWVTSDYCKEVLTKYLPDKEIFVLPDSIDINLYKEDVEPYGFRPKMKDFVFISVFGWSYRKGYDVLLKSYLQEFTGDDPVSLLIFSRYQSREDKGQVIKKTVQKFIEKYGGDNPPHIARCGQVIQEFKMPSIYKACNAFALYSRGEGFLIPACEASLCGLPVISVNHSGQTMFLNKDNSTLIEPDFFEKIQPGKIHVHFWDNQEFPSLESEQALDDAKKALRFVYENYDLAKEKNKILQEKIKKEYNIDNVASMAKKKLETIWRKT